MTNAAWVGVKGLGLTALVGALLVGCSSSSGSGGDIAPVGDSLGNFGLTIAGKPSGAPSNSQCRAGQLLTGAGTPRPSDISPGGRVTLDNACKVKKTGAMYSVEGSINLGSTGFFVRSDDVDPITRTGSAQVEVHGDGQYYSTCVDDSCPEVTNPVPCSIEVIQANTTDGPETQVKPGAIWAKLDCPLLQGGQLNDYCRGTGVFVLENCSH